MALQRSITSSDITKIARAQGTEQPQTDVGGTGARRDFPCGVFLTQLSGGVIGLIVKMAVLGVSDADS